MGVAEEKYGCRSYVSVLEEGLTYIEKRMTGEIKSLKTPWPGFNDAGVGGLEWGSMLTIGARPGSGKTMIASQLIRESHRLNPDQKFNIIEFQFEMGSNQYAARQFAAEVAEDYGVILSTKKALDNFIYEKAKQYIQETKFLFSKGINRDMFPRSLNYKEMEEAIKIKYMDGGRKPMIVTIDHSWLIKKTTSERDKFEVLYDVTEMLMKLKNEIPITVIMVTQLNRSMDDSSRKTPGSIANYPTSSDIFGGDALMQGSDMVVALSRPFKSDIRSYGPYAYEVNKEDVFMHLLKVRNGDEQKSIVFLKMDGKNQRMVEVPEFIATRPDGTYLRYSQRTGNNGTRTVSAPIGTELD